MRFTINRVFTSCILTSTILLLSMQAEAVRTRPVIAGWLVVGGLNPDANSAAAQRCSDGSLVEILSVQEEVHMSVRCELFNPNLQTTIQVTRGVPWLFECSSGFPQGDSSPGGKKWCVESGPDGGEGGNPGCPVNAGNPVDIFSGIKVQKEVDYRKANDGHLKIERTYSSQGLIANAQHGGYFGPYWRSEYDTRIWAGSLSQPAPINHSGGNAYKWVPYEQDFSLLQEPVQVSDLDYVFMFLPNGKYIYFTKQLDDSWISESDRSLKLDELSDTSGDFLGWRYTSGSNEVLVYDTRGRLASITHLEGRIQTLYYDISSANGGDDNDETLDKVTDDSNDSLSFVFAPSSTGANRITQITDPDGNSYSYSYNSDGALESVTYPDGNADPNDNPQRVYHYEYETYDYALTGITDERGVRFATWDYTQDLATRSEHLIPGQSIDQTDIGYSNVSAFGGPGNVAVTYKRAGNSDYQVIYHFEIVDATRRVNRVERPAWSHPSEAGIDCLSSDNYRSYDNGFRDVVVDWKGNAIDYDYDSQGHETQRTEGLTATVNTSVNPPSISTATTANTRTIATHWHPNFRLPTRVIEPDRIVDTTYDCDNGRLLNRVIYNPVSAPAYVAPVCPNS